MKYEIIYNSNDHIWAIEDLAKNHGFKMTDNCYWVQIFRDDNGNSIVATRDEDELLQDPVERLAAMLAPSAVEAEPATKKSNAPRKISISAGNRKMGAIPSVSLPPVVTCADGCPCAKKCYAVKICRIYKTVRAAYDRNLDILNNNPDLYWNQVNEAVKMNRYFRFHVSGDIPGPAYFCNMVSVAAGNPHCEILSFTKCYDIVNDYIRQNGPLPENLHIIFSLWDSAWNTRVKNPYDLPKSAVIFKGRTGDEFEKICGGNCFECACKGTGCWTLKNGETIAFYEH